MVGYVFAQISGRNQFAPDEDAHVIGDCIKVQFAPTFGGRRACLNSGILQTLSFFYVHENLVVVLL